ncbi:MAG: hypothetical protein P8049_04705 [Gemmatimonadota bacterium]|jgi:uncharacterized protein YbaR (Trm112 family)
MLLDLSESLVCPRCGPPQGLVVLVEEMDGRRIATGRLDCPACEQRFPLAAGVLDFREAAARASSSEESPGSGSDEVPSAATRNDADSVLVAALFGIRDRRGVLVVGPGLGESAPAIAELSGGCEVLFVEGLAADSDRGAPEHVPAGVEAGSVTSLRGVAGDAVPLLPGRALGVALVDADVGEIDEAARVLSPGGRLVVLRPESPATVLDGDPRFEPIAREERAVVARRT